LGIWAGRFTVHRVRRTAQRLRRREFEGTRALLSFRIDVFRGLRVVREGKDQGTAALSL
jgi:hypothetical protein